MTRRPTLLIVLVGLLVALTAAPAGAWPREHDRPTAVVTAAAPDPARPATWGRTASADHRLAPGCHRYRYRYLVTPPSDEWSAELFLVDPRGRGAGSAYYLSPEDPDHGAASWRICRVSAVPGRYTIKMRVTWDRYGQQRRGWVRPTRFLMVG